MIWGWWRARFDVLESIGWRSVTIERGYTLVGRVSSCDDVICGGGSWGAG